MNRHFLSILVAALSGSWLASCEAQKSTGTVDETNASAARLLDSAGAPVSGANLLVFRPQDTTGRPVTTGLTQEDGSYDLPTVADGMYRLVARVPSGKIAVQDSVYTNKGRLQVRTDTIRTPGTLTGVVRMVGDDNPQAVEVSVLGSDQSVVNVKADGTYRLEGLGAGTWKLKFSASLPNYANTYVIVRSKAIVGMQVDTVDLTYIGIPPVRNLKAVMDYPRNGLKLVWEVPPGSPPVRDFLVQSAYGSQTPYDRGSVDSARFVDNFQNNYSLPSILYYVRIRTMEGALGRVAYLKVNYDNPKKDSLRRMDSLIYADSIALRRRLWDSLAKVDSLRRSDSTNTIHRDSILPTQHAIDSIRRQETLDSLHRRIEMDLWLLGDSSKAARDSTGWDTSSLRRDLQRTQHVFDSLQAAPLAQTTQPGSPGRLAVHKSGLEPRRRQFLFRREEIDA